MDWIQVMAIIITIIATTSGSAYAFYILTDKKIDKMDTKMDKMETFHREDMKSMDAKWERLFEKLLIKEQGKV